MTGWETSGEQLGGQNIECGSSKNMGLWNIGKGLNNLEICVDFNTYAPTIYEYHKQFWLYLSDSA